MTELIFSNAFPLLIAATVVLTVIGITIALAIKRDKHISIQLKSPVGDLVIETKGAAVNSAPAGIEKNKRYNKSIKRSPMLVLKQKPGIPDFKVYLNRATICNLGSGKDNTVRIRGDYSIDKRHARIYCDNNAFKIESLSPKDTWVDNRLVKIAKLGNGSQIKLGNAIFIFQEN